MLESSMSLSSPVSLSTLRDTNMSKAPIAPTTPTITTTNVWSRDLLEVEDAADLVLFSRVSALVVEPLDCSYDWPSTLCALELEDDQPFGLALKLLGCGGP